MNLDKYVEELEQKQKLSMLKLPSMRAFKDMYSLHQTRVVQTLIDTDSKSKKVVQLSMDILKYAMSNRNKVKVDNVLLRKLYKKYENYFE